VLGEQSSIAELKDELVKNFWQTQEPNQYDDEFQT